MEKQNKYLAFSFLLLSLFLINQVSASEICDLSVTLVNQDPYPATPGDYVDILFQMSGVDNSECSGAYFELVPSYPFSVDKGETLIYKLDGSTWAPDSETDWMIPVTLRVDADAIDSNSILSVKYGQLGGNILEDFEIKVEDLTTEFDTVIQDFSTSEISIALANVGKYTANSVVVRIPEQDNYQVTGTDGQMVGNLDSGDYTIVNFDVTTNGRSSENEFLFDIYYTDSLGERRIVNMGMNLNMDQGDSINMSGMPEDFTGTRKVMKEESTNSNKWIWYITIVVILIVTYFIYKKVNMEKFKKIIEQKSKAKISSTKTPAWMVKEVKK